MELIRDLRRNGVLIGVRVLVLVMLAVAVADHVSFTRSTEQARDTALSERADVDVYTVTDEFTADPGAFEAFRRSPAEVRRLTRFVDALATLPGMRFISAFDQPVRVRDFRGDERFDVGYGTEYSVRGPTQDERGRLVHEVKAIELSRAAFDFAGLRVRGGPGIDWESVDYRSDEIPVVLGDSYAGSYSVGDHIPGNLLFRDLTFTVAGFLDPGSSMYLRGDLDHPLDDTIVVPYPPELSGLQGVDRDFLGILAFQVLNGDLAVDRPSSTDGVLAALDAVGHDSGFSHWSITGVPDYLVELAAVRQIVTDNLALLTVLLVLVSCASAVASAVLGALLARRRRPVVAAHWVVGSSPLRSAAAFHGSLALEYGVAVGLLVAACSLEPNRQGAAFLSALAVLALWAAVDAIAQHHMLVTRLPEARKESS